MARFSLNKLTKVERIRLIADFYDAVALLKNRGETAKVFRDILDGDEIGNIMRRIDIAILLTAGCTYDEIVELLGVGKNKISSVHRKLQRKEGYPILIQRILEQRKQKITKRLKKESQFKRLEEKPVVEKIKRRHPRTLLLWNIMDEFGDYLDAQSKAKHLTPKDYYKK